MARTFDAFDLVPLPRLPAEDTLALADEVCVEARREGPPPLAVGRALEVLEKAKADASACLAARRVDAPIDASAVRDADRRLDRTWSGLRDWLWGWGKLTMFDTPLADKARAAHDAVFPEGLSFLSRAFRAEWAASEEKLGLLTAGGHDGTIEALGGAPFLAAVRGAHRAYGEALHVGPQADAEGERDVRDVREALDRLYESLRAYVVQVVATVTPGDDASHERAARLLMPILAWDSAPVTAPHSLTPASDRPDDEGAPDTDPQPA